MTISIRPGVPGPQPYTPARPTDPLIVVTGGTGFIGSNLVDRLVRDGHRVRVFARAPDPVLTRFADRIEIARGDVRDQAAVTRALEGAHTVLHLAGCAKTWTRDASEFEHVNAMGTANVCAAARSLSITRVLHVSTALVAPPEGRDSLENAATRTRYQRSKAAAEQVVLGFVERGGNAVIVRPTRVYGPGPLTQSNGVTRLIDLYRRGLFRFRIDDGGALANYVFVEDVVEGLLRAVDRGAPGDVYTLAGENLSMRDLLQHLSRATRRERVVFAVPKRAARVVGGVCEAATRFGFHPPVTRNWIDLLATDWPVSALEVTRSLGFAPRPVAVGLEQTLRWLERQPDGRPAALFPPSP